MWTKIIYGDCQSIELVNRIEQGVLFVNDFCCTRVTEVSFHFNHLQEQGFSKGQMNILLFYYL